MSPLQLIKNTILEANNFFTSLVFLYWGGGHIKFWVICHSSYYGIKIIHWHQTIAKIETSDRTSAAGVNWVLESHVSERQFEIL